MKGLVLLIFICLFSFSGCDFKKKEDDLQKKEAVLNQREQELNLKENALQIKEEELKQREQKLDSTAIQDTVNAYNPAIVGNWSVKMTCTETTCTGSAIGDTKTEQWMISYDGNGLIAKAMSGDKLIRVYTGTVAGNNIELAQNGEGTPAAPAAKMVVRLSLTGEDGMKGTREIIRTDDCHIVYDLEMKKQ